MKKLLLLIFLLLTLTQFAISQNDFGIKAGLNVSSVQRKFSPPIAGIQSLKSLAGYQFGLFYKVHPDKKWSFAAEINYSAVGYRSPYFSNENFFDSALSVPGYNNNRMGYIEVPLMVQYNLHNFYIGAGPAVGFHLFSNAIDSGSYTTNHKPLDFAANILAGCTITKKLDLYLRYSHGLMDIVKDGNLYGSYNTTVSLKNRFFNLSLLYSLN